MKTKSIIAKLIPCALACLGITTTMTFAQASNSGTSPTRGGSWDVYVPLIYTTDTTIDGQGGSKAEINDDVSVGLGAGYNFNDYFQLGGSFNWNSRSYDATIVREDGSKGQYGESLETSTIAMNAICYLLPGNITPFVSGSIGYTFIDTNIQNGPTESVVFYDPWYGYVVDTYTPTKTESDFSYAAGAGLRVEVNQDFALQLSYNRMWMNLDNALDNPEVDTIRLDFTFRVF